MEGHMEAPDETEGKSWGCSRDEHGRLVSGMEAGRPNEMIV